MSFPCRWEITELLPSFQARHLFFFLPKSHQSREEEMRGTVVPLMFTEFLPSFRSLARPLTLRGQETKFQDIHSFIFFFGGE